ncbi:addiction module toxin, HicA family [Pseudactinotalea sp. HY160]|uniref:type II toxin-antitoxin system HicA family toxin n=1 Tax=Pseudactinotalea sp. HY160 TaxID=2654490 RepID=UPI00129C55FA|nr:addiction module toxin, HicA family [Pseudactinotalea sp. HY160]QGH71007.1 addiction module toxin, HicA family [Pseudactinotalea sp. HY158]
MVKEVKYRRVAAQLRLRGWVIGRTRGSHEMWVSPEGRRLVLPKHRMISAGVVRSVIAALDGDAPDAWR